MKKLLQLVAQGIVLGATAALTLFFLIEHITQGERSEIHDSVKRHYTVEEVSFSEPAPSNVEGAFETTVTFKVKNTNKNKLVRAFVDVEFFDSDGVFLFDYNHGSPWGEFYLPPRSIDNASVDVIFPEAVKSDSVASVTVEVYELSK